MSNIKNPQSNPLKSSAPVRPPGGDTTPKKVYVCSPFRPTAVSLADRAEEQRSNIERALKACRILAMIGIQPLAPHLYFTRFLKDDVAAERDAGMRYALSWLEQADELWVFGDTVSEGMAQEIAKAKELGKPVHTIPEPGRVAELLVQSIAQKYNMTADGQQDILDPMMVYSGCYCNVSVNFYAFNANGNRGVAAGLGNIQFVKDGDRLSGRASAEADFDALEDDEEVLGGDSGEELPDYLR